MPACAWLPHDFTCITFEQREYLASSDACQSTIVLG